MTIRGALTLSNALLMLATGSVALVVWFSQSFITTVNAELRELHKRNGDFTAQIAGMKSEQEAHWDELRIFMIETKSDLNYLTRERNK